MERKRNIEYEKERADRMEATTIRDNELMNSRSDKQLELLVSQDKFNRGESERERAASEKQNQLLNARADREVEHVLSQAVIDNTRADKQLANEIYTSKHTITSGYIQATGIAAFAGVNAATAVTKGVRGINNAIKAKKLAKIGNVASSSSNLHTLNTASSRITTGIGHKLGNGSSLCGGKFAKISPFGRR